MCFESKVVHCFLRVVPNLLLTLRTGPTPQKLPRACPIGPLKYCTSVPHTEPITVGTCLTFAQQRVETRKP